MILPDPDDPRFGLWVDRWLTALRAAGANARTLACAARALGRAARRRCHVAGADAVIVAAFRAWCRDHAGEEFVPPAD